MRTAFIEELIKAARENEKVFLIVGDLGYGVVEAFANEFPDRFINAGVAEQNMMGMAAGIASEGFHVFVYSIANFPTFRCAEQIRNDVAYHNLSVTVVSVGGGLSYGALGYSHHAIQDYGLVRMMPNMLIATPADPLEVRGCMEYLLQNPAPSYLRLGKAGEPSFHDCVPILRPGSWVAIRQNKKKSRIACLVTGGALGGALESFPKDYDFFTIPLWGMGYKSQQPEQLGRYDVVLAVEDHLIDCGMGSWLLEAIADSEKCETKIKTIGLNAKVTGMAACQRTLNEFGGICQVSL